MKIKRFNLNEKEIKGTKEFEMNEYVKTVIMPKLVGHKNSILVKLIDDYIKEFGGDEVDVTYFMMKKIINKLKKYV